MFNFDFFDHGESSLQKNEQISSIQNAEVKVRFRKFLLSLQILTKYY